MANDGLYFEAASIVDSVRNGKGRIKTLCYSSNFRNKKALFALVSETCKNYKLLNEALEKAMFFKAEKKVTVGKSILIL
jgi:hypothetical protein